MGTSFKGTGRVIPGACDADHVVVRWRPVRTTAGHVPVRPQPETPHRRRGPRREDSRRLFVDNPEFYFFASARIASITGEKKNCFGVGVTRSRHTIQSNIRSGALTVAAVAPLGRPRGFRSSGSGRQGPQGADAAKTARPQGKHAAAVTTAAAARPARATGTGKGPAARRRRGVSCRYYFLQISNEEGCLSYGEGDGAKSFRRAERFS